MSVVRPLDRLLLSGLTAWAVGGLLPVGVWTGVAALAYYENAWGLWLRGALVILLVTALVLVVSRGRVEARLRAILGRVVRVPAARFVAATAAVATAEAAAVATWCFARNPPAIDAWVQYFQAKIFLAHALAAPPPPSVAHFGLLHTLVTARGWFAQFPPLHPALLAIGMALGQPWLVTPLCAAPFTAAVYLLGRRTGDERVARVAAGLALLSPFNVAMAASGMNHLPAALAVAVGLWAVPDVARGAGWAGAVLGAATGALLGLRPLDATILAAIGTVALACGIVQRRGGRALLAALAAGTAAALPTLVFNLATTGDPLRFGYLALYGDAHGLGFHAGPWGATLTPWRALGLTAVDAHQLNVYLLEWPLPVTALVALGLWRGGGRLDAGLRAAIAFVLGLIGALFFYFHRDTLFGPRLLFSALAPLLVLVAAALVRLAERGRALGDGALLATAATAVFAVVALAPARLASYRVTDTSLALHPERDAARAGLAHAVVLVPDAWGSRLIVRLWAAGIPMGESNRIYQSFDACALEERLDADEPGEVLAARLRAEMPTVDPGRMAPGVTRDSLLRLPSDGRLTERCAAEIERDRQGTVQFAAFAWLNAPSLDGEVVWARALGAQDDVLRRLYPDRAIYRYELDRDGTARFAPLGPSRVSDTRVTPAQQEDASAALVAFAERHATCSQQPTGEVRR